MDKVLDVVLEHPFATLGWVLLAIVLFLFAKLASGVGRNFK